MEEYKKLNIHLTRNHNQYLHSDFVLLIFISSLNDFNFNSAMTGAVII